MTSTVATLKGETEACLDPDTLRYQFNFADGAHENMQISSADVDPEIGDWANREDCPAFIVDWVRNEGAGASRDEAFINGTLPSGLDRDACDLAHTSRKIVSHYTLSEAPWQVLVESDSDGCNTEPVWMGSSEGPSSRHHWFRFNDRVRVITQGWVYAFPSEMQAYMQTDADDGCPSPRQCCYLGQPVRDCH